MLYAGVVTKQINIRLDDDIHARLVARAEAEGTTVTALITQAAERDPRLDGGAATAAAFLAKHAAEFADAFPEEEPDSATGQAA
jgi:predicted transcriptional regulator